VVKALRYYSDGPGIDPRWCHLDFFRGSFRQNHVPWSRLSLWKWVPGISPGVKAAGAFGWQPTTLVVPKVEKIRDLYLPGTPRVTSAWRGIPLLYFTSLFVCSVLYILFSVCQQAFSDSKRNIHTQRLYNTTPPSITQHFVRISFYRTENHRQWNAVWPPDDGHKDARNMLRNNSLPIKSLIVASSWYRLYLLVNCIVCVDCVILCIVGV
jgi:hypothetical protein